MLSDATKERLWRQASRGHEISFEVVAPQGTSRSLVYRVFKENPILNLFKEFWYKEIWYWPWKYEPKSVALSNFNLDCVKKFIMSLPRVGSIFWYILTHLLVKMVASLEPRLFIFEPVSGALYKLTERVLNCCIWSQKVLVLVLVLVLWNTL